MYPCTLSTGSIQDSGWCWSGFRSLPQEREPLDTGFHQFGYETTSVLRPFGPSRRAVSCGQFFLLLVGVGTFTQQRFGIITNSDNTYSDHRKNMQCRETTVIVEYSLCVYVTQYLQYSEWTLRFLFLCPNLIPRTNYNFSLLRGYCREPVCSQKWILVTRERLLPRKCLMQVRVWENCVPNVDRNYLR